MYSTTLCAYSVSSESFIFNFVLHPVLCFSSLLILHVTSLQLIIYCIMPCIPLQKNVCEKKSRLNDQKSFQCVYQTQVGTATQAELHQTQQKISVR